MNQPLIQLIGSRSGQKRYALEFGENRFRLLTQPFLVFRIEMIGRFGRFNYI
jgi:hypothetical protein